MAVNGKQRRGLSDWCFVVAWSMRNDNGDMDVYSQRVQLPRAWLIGCFWVGSVAIGVLALLPATLPLPSTGWDKANHALAFAALALLGARCWPEGRSIVLPGLLAYGGAIELAQTLFTSTRMGEWSDLLADAVGLGIAAVMWAKASNGAGRANAATD